MYEREDDFMGGLSAASQPLPASTMTPEMLRQLQQGAATVGNAAQSGALSNMFAPGTLSQFDPLYEYAKTAPILSLKGNTEYENLNFQALPDTKYQLTVGGNVVGSAATPEQVAELVKQANAISAQGGKAVDVRLQKEVQAASRTGEPITAFEDVYANKENNMGALDTLIPLALTAMGAGVLGAPGAFAKGASAIMPGILGTGLGAAGGSFVGSMATGAKVEDALKKAAISGLTAGAMKGLMPGGTSGGVGPMPDIDYAGLNSMVFGGGSALPGAALEPMLTATAGKLAGAALPSVFGGAASGLSSSALNSQNQGSVKPDEPTLEALGVRNAQTGLDNAAGGIANIVSATESLGRAPDTMEEEATVTGRRYGDPDLGSELVGGGAGALTTATVQPGDEPLIDVANKSTADTKLGTALAVGGAGAGTLAATAGGTPPATTSTTVQPGDEPLIDVVNKSTTDTSLGSTLTTGGAGALAQESVQTASERAADQTQEETKEGDKKDNTVKKVVGGLQLLDALLKAIGGGRGGGGQGNGSSAISSIFTDQLPTPSAGYSPESFKQRTDLGNVDWKRYGFRPERSFFDYVPANATEYNAALGAQAAAAASRPPSQTFASFPASQQQADPFEGKTPSQIIKGLSPDASDAEIEEYLATPEGRLALQMIVNGRPPQFVPRARGGALAVKKGGAPSKESFAVKGPGTGRSDEIPALLSDGEYVIDAETVALLGDGSSEAGAKRLDDFRVNVRKHKGSNLARGKFSANAKRPEKYLAGGSV
jgi:hypothetical protein